MKRRTWLALALAVPALVLGASAAQAQNTVKIGLIAEFTGPFADYGTQIYNGIKTYIKLHGDTFGGKKVEFVVKDTTGASRLKRSLPQTCAE